MSRPSDFRARQPPRAGLLLALMALAVQLAAASITLPLTVPAVTVDRLVASSICHPGQAPAHRPAPRHTVCPLLQAVAQAGMLLVAPTVTLDAPAAVAWRPAMPPPARAPPSPALVSAYPRGPPALI